MSLDPIFTLHPSLTITSTSVGLGFLTSTPLPPSCTLLTIPQTAVLTHAHARAHLPSLPTPVSDQLALQIYMALHRNDETSPHHAYLSSLAASTDNSTNPLTWPLPLLALLAGTNVHAAVLRQKTTLRECVETACVEGLTVEGLTWAAGCYMSRAFPGRLGVDG